MSDRSGVTGAARVLEERRRGVAGLDRNVKILGLVSLLNDLSSEVAVRTLPLFLANVLGVGTGIIGFIEGVAETTATLLKMVSGYLSDRLGKKKALTLWGYGLSGFTKPLLYFANTWALVLLIRFLDRAGKGIRTAPRDALIADVTPQAQRGRVLDSTGQWTRWEQSSVFFSRHGFCQLCSLTKGLSPVQAIKPWFF